MNIENWYDGEKENLDFFFAEWKRLNKIDPVNYPLDCEPRIFDERYAAYAEQRDRIAAQRKRY